MAEGVIDVAHECWLEGKELEEVWVHKGTNNTGDTKHGGVRNVQTVINEMKEAMDKVEEAVGPRTLLNLSGILPRVKWEEFGARRVAREVNQALREDARSVTKGGRWRIFSNREIWRDDLIDPQSDKLDESMRIAIWETYFVGDGIHVTDEGLDALVRGWESDRQREVEDGGFRVKVVGGGGE